MIIVIEAFFEKIGELFAEKAMKKASGAQFTPKVKRILLIVVCICMLVFGIVCFHYFGFQFRWSLNDKGVLTLKKGFLSNGEMPSYSFIEPNRGTYVYDGGEDWLLMNDDVYPYPIFVNKTPWFNRREEITYVILPDGITNIAPVAFAGCVNLKEVYIPDSVTVIGDYAFYDCYLLEHVFLPASIISVGKYAFSQCRNLKSVGQASSLHNDKYNYIESNKYHLMEIESDNYGFIGDCAFCNCEKLEHIDIPFRFTSIGESAFTNCSSLTEILMHIDVTSIGDGAFKNCSSLTGIYIPDGVREIGIGTFYNCSSLADIIMPDSVTRIWELAFYNCDSLTEITIPENVEWIRYKAFMDCDNLSCVTVSDSTTKIEWWVFDSCKNLKTANIPKNTEIGEYAFPEWTEIIWRES